MCGGASMLRSILTSPRKILAAAAFSLSELLIHPGTASMRCSLSPLEAVPGLVAGKIGPVESVLQVMRHHHEMLIWTPVRKVARQPHVYSVSAMP